MNNNFLKRIFFDSASSAACLLELIAKSRFRLLHHYMLLQCVCTKPREIIKLAKQKFGFERDDEF